MIAHLFTVCCVIPTMRPIFQAYLMIFILGNLVASQSSGWKHAINTTIINFNNEKMQITWAARELFPNENVSFFYTFDEGKHKVWKSCTIYLLDQDYNSGCLFKTEGPTLAISIRNSKGSEELFSKKLKSDFYIKPNRPENVTFFWKEDTVTVSCNKPERAARCLRLELQYKSKFDKEWQSRTSKCCSVAEQGFDPKKCYSFRVRLGRLVPYCNVVNYTSDWEAETFWMNGMLLDSCDDDTISQSNTVIVLSCLLAVLLMMLILLILLCKRKRVQMSILPAIPDPKYLFADLFNDHNGNLQEWLDKNNQVVLQTKLEYEEPESITEAESQQEDGKNSDKQEPLEKTFTFSGAAENNDVKAAEIACLKPTSNTMTSFAGFHILSNDDTYVML
ncbi:cytokine receptor-like factor 2 isoform X2 [Corvus cornix cornix]|uniref:cytokine receptor-like factor 2 isoform X6 n=3 Tax=Corvus TaxID=30420 RepID=UPI00081667F2|nr:PREDICTED: cytokine receptor-like factor 2 isoform X6 [Corvus brachyrhynchos]XP_019138208.1 cytokine receptor-like factor 2 isoform X2 [Corvus cornix cornix]XP_019138209.1 cytokine receptor-like factor 2 isoform X2 [Corvus cornix cornix]